MRLFILCLAAGILLNGCTTQTKERISDPEARVQLEEFVKGLGPSRGRGQGIARDSMTRASFAAALQRTRDQLIALRKIDTGKLAGDDLIDWKFAHSILRGREIDQASYEPWKRDPRIYMAFTGISGVIHGPGESAAKVDQIEQRLAIAVVQLTNGMQQLEVHVPRFQELGLFMAENGLVLFDQELPAFILSAGPEGARLAEPARRARTALVKFIDFLKKDLPQKPAGNFSLGAGTYNDMLRDQYLFSFDADSLLSFGWHHFEKTVTELEEVARRIDPAKTWQQLAIDIKNNYPAPGQMIEAHQWWVDKAGEHIRKNNLIPIPWKEQVKVVPRAEYLRKTSYYGNFSFARGMDADSVYRSEWRINPFEDQWDDKRKQEYLVEHDWGVIIVTAPHETYAGHHVHGLYQANNPRPLRREHSISLFSEGWGLYNEQLMRETGFLPNDSILLRQLQLRLWRNARVIYDVGLHTGKMTYEEAIALMTERVGFLRWAAQLEVDACSAAPGYFIGYFTGMMEILRMREDYKKLKGDQFTLSDFHEKLLQGGSMPTSLMREALWGRGSR
jgi:hypothetical protein